MARVYSHGSEHVYTDWGRRLTIRIPANGWTEVPEDVASYIVPATPTKLCDVSGEENPDEHRCRLSKAGDEEMGRRASEEKAAVEAAATFDHEMSASTRMRQRALAKRLGRNPSVAAR